MKVGFLIITKCCWRKSGSFVRF